MKTSLFISMILVSLLGLNSSYALPSDPEEIRITAHLIRLVKSMEATLFYDEKMLATIAIQDSLHTDITWAVLKKDLSCNNFEEAIPHLHVTRDGEPLAVVRFSCISF